MIYVIATAELQPGCRDKFLAEFHKIVPAVRAEEGCIEYGPTVDAETGYLADHNTKNKIRVSVKEEVELTLPPPAQPETLPDENRPDFTPDTVIEEGQPDL